MRKPRSRRSANASRGWNKDGRFTANGPPRNERKEYRPRNRSSRIGAGPGTGMAPLLSDRSRKGIRPGSRADGQNGATLSSCRSFCQLMLSSPTGPRIPLSQQNSDSGTGPRQGCRFRLVHRAIRPYRRRSSPSRALRIQTVFEPPGPILIFHDFDRTPRLRISEPQEINISENKSSDTISFSLPRRSGGRNDTGRAFPGLRTGWKNFEPKQTRRRIPVHDDAFAGHRTFADPDTARYSGSCHKPSCRINATNASSASA